MSMLRSGVNTLSDSLVGGLEHEFYFSVYFRLHLYGGVGWWFGSLGNQSFMQYTL